MRSHLHRRSIRLLLVVTVLCTVGAGVAYATIPDGNGVIHGCILAKQGNVLKVIDTAKGQTCGTGNPSLNWNQTGPPGPQGQAGPTGPQGLQGRTGTGNAVGMTGNGGILNGGSPGPTMQAVTSTLNIPSDGSSHKVLLTAFVMISCITGCSDSNVAPVDLVINDDTTRVNPYAAYTLGVSESNTVVPLTFVVDASAGSHPYHLDVTAWGSNQIVVQGPTLNAVDLGPTP